MLVTFVPYFAMGVPQAQPGAYDVVPNRQVTVLFVVILLVACGFVLLRVRRRRTMPPIGPIDLTATTKACSYRGRENDLQAAHCRECGTAFLILQVDRNPSEHDANPA